MLILNFVHKTLNVVNVIRICICENFFCVKCSGTSKGVFLSKQELSEPWICQQCLSLVHDNENNFAVNSDKSQPAKQKK